jgi:hypothetical protein
MESLPDPIRDKWSALGGAQGPLGQAVTREFPTSDGIGRYENFQYGSIYWTQATGAHALLGAIRDRWVALGAESSSLGYPVTDTPAPVAMPVIGWHGWNQWNDFQCGSICYTPGHTVLVPPIINPITGGIVSGGSTYVAPPATCVVDGPIGVKYAVAGWETGSLGFPVTQPAPTHDGIGRFAQFDTGFIYYKSSTGAHTIMGPVYAKWASQNCEQGALGYPMTDITAAPDQVGQYTNFENGTIYAGTGMQTHILTGPVRDRWEALGWANSPVGQPLSDVMPTADNLGQCASFETSTGLWGAIYYRPCTGTCVLTGPVLEKWVSLGAETGLLGYPMGDQQLSADKVWSSCDFQNGTIKWSQTFHHRLSFTRDQMVGLFNRIGASGSVSVKDFNTLQTWLADRVGVEMPDYVRVLANKVVNGDPANATYQFLDNAGNVQTVALGNLHPGSSSGQLTELVNKWFLGMDEPTALVSYQPVGPGVPLKDGSFHYYDVVQGKTLGDCWLEASLAELAVAGQDYLKDMFIYNGLNFVNGNPVLVYAVRFFVNGVPDYVTVDTELPGGGHYYGDITHANVGSTWSGNGQTLLSTPDGTFSSAYWAALAEKAYAQENHSGGIGSSNPGVNSYAALVGGWASWALPALTGLACSKIGGVNGNDVITAFKSGKLIVLSTDDPDTPVLRGYHEYALVNYDPGYQVNDPFGMASGIPNAQPVVAGMYPSTLPFELYNPWGIKLTTLGFTKSYSQYDLFTVNAPFLAKYFAREFFTLAGMADMREAQEAGHASPLLQGLLPKPSLSQEQLRTRTEEARAAPGAVIKIDHLDAVFSNEHSPMQVSMDRLTRSAPGEGQNEREAGELLCTTDRLLREFLD